MGLGEGRGVFVQEDWGGVLGVGEQQFPWKQEPVTRHRS